MRLRWLGVTVVVALVAVWALPDAAQAQNEPQDPKNDRVRAWEEEVVIPTYAPYPDDLNPKFFELEGSIIYPYTMQDNLSATRADKTYRGVYLENEYLKVMVLPEIGGRIQTVYDKIRGTQMFHDNGVVKPGLIALRGAWISGGVEWNRGPTGHTVTSFSPVDVVTVENRDGSASVIIGYTEMNFRTTWQVRLTLHPGHAVLDEQISISNPTDGFHSYYFWNNTAFPNTPGTRFIYPMSLGSDHNGTSFFSWPIHEGRDLSWLKNYPDSASVFAYECVFDFFGAYDVDRDYGIVQVANHHELPGKKAWTWGESDRGLAAQAAVLDSEAGLYETAAVRLAQALDRDPTNGMTAYLLGVAKLHLDDLDAALELGFTATKQPETVELGFSLIGRAQMRAGEREAALLSFTRGFDRGGRDRIRLFEQLLIAAYDAEHWNQATSIALSPIRTGTTRLVPHAVMMLLGEVSAADFARGARAFVGEDEFAFIELSLTFADLGLYREAADLLSATTFEALDESQHRPLPFYYLAYYESRLGNRARAAQYLERAAMLEADYVFPSRPETIVVLEYAIARSPDDARAHEYLGNLFAGLGRMDEAVRLWTAAADLDPGLSVARRNLGLHAWRQEEDLDAAAEWYAAAIDARPSDQTLHRDLGRVEIARGRHAEAVAILEAMPSTPRQRGDAIVLLARTYNDVRRYDDTIALLDRTTFSNREGDSDTRRIFSTAHVERGMLKLDAGEAAAALADFDRALTYPKNLNAGRPSQPREARAQYWRGRALDALGRTAEARVAWQAGAQNVPSNDEQVEYIRRSREALSSNP